MDNNSLFWICTFMCIYSAVCDIEFIVVNNKIGRFQLQPEMIDQDGETIREVQRFGGEAQELDHFKTMMIEGSSMLIGARNVVYKLSLEDLREQWRIDWEPSDVEKTICQRQQSGDECQNYIRVIAKKSENQLLICGTHAYNPYCRVYHVQDNEDPFGPIADMSGNGRCPFDPKQNNTALYIDRRLYSATTADRQSRDALIFGSAIENRGMSDLDLPSTSRARAQLTPMPQLPPTLRTQQYDSQWLNEPNHVQGFEYGDKVYFLFSEEAVEYINCGKKVFSRVGRVCKNDQGGKWVLKNTWSSYFKARLNCSIPGEFPFHFDEIQSATDIGRGNFMSTISSLDNRTDMFYAVFNTPENSIHGSAVCAFRMSDVLQVFEGPFKDQKQPNSNWLPVSDMDTPHPHPAKTCSNDSTSISDQTLNFIKTHPLMDGVVPSFGAQPVMVQASTNYRLTKIAVDWQVHAADGRYYDVLFIGTDDGRVLKTINYGISQVETVIIEDIEVFHDKSPVVNIKVYRNRDRGEAKLVVVSANEVKTVPLQRCHLSHTCSECVATQDPYCSWHRNRCLYSRLGLQSIYTAKHHECPAGEIPTTIAPDSTPAAAITCPPCPTCRVATSGDGDNNQNPAITPKPNHTDTRMMESPYEGPTPTEMSNEIPLVPIPDPVKMEKEYSSGDMATAVVTSVFLSLIIGFVLGAAFVYFFFHRRAAAKRRDSRGGMFRDSKPSGVYGGGETKKALNEYHGVVDVDSLKKHRHDDQINVNTASTDNCYGDAPNYALLPQATHHVTPPPSHVHIPVHPHTPNLRPLPEKPNNLGMLPNNLRQQKTVNETPRDANTRWQVPSLPGTNSKGVFT